MNERASGAGMLGAGRKHLEDMMFVVRLAEYGNCWLAPWSGDPGRTVVLENAKRYKTRKTAMVAARREHKRYNWRKIGIVEPAPANAAPCA